MSFNYNQTQLSIIDSVQNIMTNFDDDYWLKCDKESNFPHEFYQEIATGGWLGICMPKEYGGAALGIREASIFMQKISDVSVRCTAKHGAVLLGDASIVLRPHVGNGASMAISDALTLSHQLLNNDNIKTAITQWQENQLPERVKMYELSKRMGNNLVLNNCSWQKTTTLKMDAWWADIIQDKNGIQTP